MDILRGVLFRKERMVGPKESRVKVAEKEETGKFRCSPDGGPNSEESPWQGFVAALAVLIIGASQSRQHGMSEPARRSLTD
ncbi:hypothetical protein Tco_1028371 [Tanacetum coccineum]|uniref:Uncharacterized protein n=1 Tax=Tanacetum coccineum TaxID=301880 RepID=A0ABQ5G0Q0_9ASTR